MTSPRISYQLKSSRFGKMSAENLRIGYRTREQQPAELSGRRFLVELWWAAARQAGCVAHDQTDRSAVETTRLILAVGAFVNDKSLHFSLLFFRKLRTEKRSTCFAVRAF